MTFATDADEAEWVVEDIRRDRDAHGFGWGDVALLYRKHEIGDRLESMFLNAGIPCRLARGRSLIEDAVIGYVIAALRIVRMPDDAGALHAFAQLVLSEHFLQEVEAALEETEPFLTSMRQLAARRPREDPDTKKLWRLIFQVENLRALPRAQANSVSESTPWAVAIMPPPSSHTAPSSSASGAPATTSKRSHAPTGCRSSIGIDVRRPMTSCPAPTRRAAA